MQRVLCFASGHWKTAKKFDFKRWTKQNPKQPEQQTCERPKGCYDILPLREILLWFISGPGSIKLAAPPTLCLLCTERHILCLSGCIFSKFFSVILLWAISPCWTPSTHRLWGQCKTAVCSRTLSSGVFSSISTLMMFLESGGLWLVLFIEGLVDCHTGTDKQRFWAT